MVSPSSCRIGPYDFEIRWGDVAEQHALDRHAYINYEHTFMWFNKDLKPDQLAIAFHHEVDHGIRWERNLAETAPDEDCALASCRGWVAFWRDNPEVMRWWAGLIMPGATFARGFTD